MGYSRVLPRDLFNEAKLLKCMGRVALYIHDGIIPNTTILLHHEPESGFKIEQGIDGETFVINLVLISYHDVIPLSSPLNSRANYPLEAFWEDEYVRVFNEDGDLTDEFKKIVNR